MMSEALQIGALIAIIAVDLSRSGREVVYQDRWHSAAAPIFVSLYIVVRCKIQRSAI